MTKGTQQLLAVAFGVTFVIVLLILAIQFPSPSAFQYLVFRVVLALASAGVAVMLPGSLELEMKGTIRAGGAVALFVAVYFANPAKLALAVQDGPEASGSIEIAQRTESLSRQLDAIQALNKKVVDIGQAGRSLWRASNEAIHEIEENQKPDFTYGCSPRVLEAAGELYRARDQT